MHQNPDSEAAQRRELHRIILALSVREKRAMTREMFPGARQHLCGDFLALDFSQEENFSGQIVILHLPSMCWHAFEMSVEQALDMLEAGKDLDGLLNLITHSAEN